MRSGWIPRFLMARLHFLPLRDVSEPWATARALRSSMIGRWWCRQWRLGAEIFRLARKTGNPHIDILWTEPWTSASRHFQHGWKIFWCTVVAIGHGFGGGADTHRQVVEGKQVFSTHEAISRLRFHLVMAIGDLFVLFFAEPLVFNLWIWKRSCRLPPTELTARLVTLLRKKYRSLPSMPVCLDWIKFSPRTPQDAELGVRAGPSW